MTTLILTRDNITSTVKVITTSFIPKIYTKNSMFKQEVYELDHIEDNKAYYKFSYERSNLDGKIC